jgi:chromosome segregation ATPase
MATVADLRSQLVGMQQNFQTKEELVVTDEHFAVISDMEFQIAELRSELEATVTRRMTTDKRREDHQASGTLDDDTQAELKKWKGVAESLENEIEGLQKHLAATERSHEHLQQTYEKLKLNHDVLMMQHAECPAIIAALHAQIEDIKKQTMVTVHVCMNNAHAHQREYPCVARMHEHMRLHISARVRAFFQTASFQLSS